MVSLPHLLAGSYVAGALLTAFIIFRKPSGWPWWLKAVGIGAWPLWWSSFAFLWLIARGDQ